MCFGVAIYWILISISKFDCYTLTAGVMTCGGIEFKTKGRDDQAECENVGPDR